MKRLAIILTAKLCLASHLAFGIAASQAWVENYVSNYVARTAAEVQAGTVTVHTNGSMVVTANQGRTNEMRLVVPDFTDAAMIATNCTMHAEVRGITNGTVFVWNGAGAYINPRAIISCTSTNLVLEGVGSVTTDGLERFAGWFDAYGGLIQADTSFAITNGMTEVHQ